MNDRPSGSYTSRYKGDAHHQADRGTSAAEAGVSRPGGLHAVLSLYRAHQIDAEQNRKHLTQRLHVPVLAVGGASYLGDEVRRHMEQAAHQVSPDTLALTCRTPGMK